MSGSKVLASDAVEKRTVVRSFKADLKIVKYCGILEKQTPLYSCFPKLGHRKLQRLTKFCLEELSLFRVTSLNPVVLVSAGIQLVFFLVAVVFWI